MKTKGEKLWTSGFLLICQGQLVSTFGDAAYSIALGFWVLQTTGSTALMGTLMAVSALPGIIISPFAGVWLDRLNRKPFLILMDIIRGICMVLIASAAYMNCVRVWMVFAAGIMISICSAVFRPGVNSSIPELVPKSRLANANSILSMVSTGSNMLGNIAGGFLYQVAGAPLLFMANGISYFFSGGTLSFVKLPVNTIENKQNFLKDMREGFCFIWNEKGLRYLLLIAALFNFFSYVAIVLFLPMFQKTPSLGAGRYGIAMACFMAGAMGGFLILSIWTIPSNLKLATFILSNAITNTSLIIAVNQQQFVIMVLFIISGGFFNSIVNVTILSTVQAMTPNKIRGKVMAFMNMITQSLTPFAMALGGVLASFIPITIIISTSFMLLIFVVTPFAFVKPFSRFINYNNLLEKGA